MTSRLMCRISSDIAWSAHGPSLGPMGRASAEAGGIPDYPFAIIPHPIGRLSEAELRERVEAALPQVVELLTR